MKHSIIYKMLAVAIRFVVVCMCFALFIISAPLTLMLAASTIVKGKDVYMSNVHAWIDTYTWALDILGSICVEIARF